MATLRAYTAFVEVDFNVSKTIYAQFRSDFIDNGNTVISGKTYQDAAIYEYAGVLPMTLRFGGTGLARGQSTALTAGTVTGFTDFWGRTTDAPDPHFVVQGISVDAALIGQVQSTATTEDDIQVLQAAFSGDDTFYLSRFEDWASGYDGNDTMLGYGGGDLLYGGNGNDKLVGGDGDDQLEGGNGDDLLLGGAGRDTVSYLSAEAGVTVDLRVGIAQDTGGAGIDTLRSFERLYGSAFDDQLTGNGYDNEIIGLDGADTVNGGGGNDRIDGGGGHDTLIGGAGADQFVVFTFFSADDSDTIVDFRRIQGDKILLSNQTFHLTGNQGDALSANEFYIRAGASAAHDADDRIIYDPKSGKVWFDHDGLGGDAAVHVLTIGAGATHPLLAASDFELSF